MTISIETYLNSLSDNIDRLDICCKGIKSLPDLTRFKNLKILSCYHNQLTCLPNLPENLIELYCSDNKFTYLPTLPENLELLSCYHNQLTSLPNLPQNLIELYCSDNKLTYLPTLPENLELLSCYHNKLTSLPNLPENLKYLYCSDNKLTYLPTLPENLKEIGCYNNKLTYLPTLPENLEELYFYNNTISEIVNNNNSYILFQIKKNIQILNNFRHLYYCLKFKKQLRKWLWEKVREPNAKKLYYPNYLVENLKEEDDLETFLDNWINK